MQTPPLGTAEEMLLITSIKIDLMAANPGMSSDEAELLALQAAAKRRELGI